MNRPLIGYIFIITAIAIAVSSLFYIKLTHKTMDEKLNIIIENAINNDKEAVKTSIKDCKNKQNLFHNHISI